MKANVIKLAFKVIPRDTKHKFKHDSLHKKFHRGKFQQKLLW